MSNTVPAQHPAVVLRSTYQHLRALLAIATIAIVGLTIAVVILAANNSATATVIPAVHASHASARVTPTQVAPNPDQLGPQPSPAPSAPISSYPGHF